MEGHFCTLTCFSDNIQKVLRALRGLLHNRHNLLPFLRHVGFPAIYILILHTATVQIFFGLLGPRHVRYGIDINIYGYDSNLLEYERELLEQPPHNVTIVYKYPEGVTSHHTSCPDH